MIFRALFLAGLVLIATPARAQTGGPTDRVDAAFNAAIAAFERARPALGATAFGVDVESYGDALTLGRFHSAHWGGQVALSLEQQSGNGGSCGRFAAYVRLPPRDGVVSLVICPQFSAEGTDPLRRLTILHEMVHVVAGPDECRAMAFAARVEHFATGSHTPVDRYWQANGCEGSGFRLP